ncbi:MAG: two-component regulator propeller domain-containing protein, partial [Ginsengibacter sp.]
MKSYTVIKVRFLMAVKISIVFLFITNSCFAQKTQLDFSLVTDANGKSLGKIMNMTQDPHGYMWFAGEDPGNCIYRYDGNKIITYRHDDANPNSLASTSVRSVYADNSGIIWIGVGKGLDQFNPATGIFKHYRHVPNDPGSLSGGVTAILKDRQGRLWVGGDGLDRLDEKTGKFIHYRNEPGNQKSLSSNFVWCIYEDHQGVIWVGTGFPWFNKDPGDGGLNRLEPDGSFTRYMHDPNNPHSLINNKVAAIYEDSRGMFWVGTSGDGLHTMDRKTGLFERHLYNPKEPGKLSRPPLRPGEENDKISFINEDSTGAIWIGTIASGINRYDAATKKITHYEGSNGFPDSTSWNAFTSRDGELWISTQNNNLYRVDPFNKSIQSTTTVKPALQFLEDLQGYLWVPTLGNGLFKYDKNLNVIQQFKHDPANPKSLSDDGVLYLLQTGNDSIWVGSFGGVQILNTFTQQFSTFHNDPIMTKTEGQGINQIFRDKYGAMWFCRWGGGLIRYTPKDSSFNFFHMITNDSSSIGSNNIWDIREDRSGTLWFGGMGGIYRFIRQTGRFRNYLNGSIVSCLYKDSRGNFWAGTNTGLFRYSEKDDRFSVFLDPNSYVSSLSVNRIVEDDKKNLWLNSTSGILKINPETKESFIYAEKFGVLPNDMFGINKTSKGQILVGHVNGFYTFYPGELAVKTDFEIIVTDFFISSIPVLPGKESPLQKPIEDISQLSLKYNQNSFSFNFRAIDYRSPQTIKYFTMLENYDNTWREVIGEKSSSYFYVPPGQYVFRIQAYNANGTKAEKMITIYVNPPWWKTWLAYSIYALLLLLTILAFYRNQK